MGEQAAESLRLTRNLNSTKRSQHPLRRIPSSHGEGTGMTKEEQQRAIRELAAERRELYGRLIEASR